MGPRTWLSGKGFKLGGGCSIIRSLRKQISCSKTTSCDRMIEASSYRLDAHHEAHHPSSSDAAAATTAAAATHLAAGEAPACATCRRPAQSCCCCRPGRPPSAGEQLDGRPKADLGFAHSASLSASLQRGGLARFRDLKQIGRGRTSLVYSAVCAEKGKPVVVKVYQKALLSQEGERQVRREIECLNSVRHPNIIELYTSFESEQGFFLVFEHARGGDLYRKLLTCGTVSEETAVRKIIAPLLATLHYLKTQDIIHRDLKPENLLLTEDGTLKVADFGFAICCTKERPKARVGTLDFMPPEVIRTQCGGRAAAGDEPIVPGVQAGPGAAYDDKVDVWACGVVAFELLTGRPPFEVPGKAATCTAILTRELPLGCGWPRHLSPECISFLKMALCKAPSKRPSAEELLRHPWVLKFGTAVPEPPLGGGREVLRTTPEGEGPVWDHSSSLQRSLSSSSRWGRVSFAATWSTSTSSLSSSSSCPSSSTSSSSLLEQSNELAASVLLLLSGHARALAGLLHTVAACFLAAAAAAAAATAPPPPVAASSSTCRGRWPKHAPPRHSILTALLFGLGLAS